MSNSNSFITRAYDLPSQELSRNAKRQSTVPNINFLPWILNSARKQLLVLIYIIQCFIVRNLGAALTEILRRGEERRGKLLNMAAYT